MRPPPLPALRAWSFLVLAAVSGPARAYCMVDDVNPTHVTLRGPGGSTCLDYRNSVDIARRGYVSWILGFVSGLDSYTDKGDVGEGAVNSGELVSAVDALCGRRPNERLSRVVADYILTKARACAAR